MAAPVVAADPVGDEQPPHRAPFARPCRWIHRTSGPAGRTGEAVTAQRTALVLRYYEGLSDAEIAGVMGCAQSTVRGHVFKALAALRTELDQPLAAAPSKETQ